MSDLGVSLSQKQPPEACPGPVLLDRGSRRRSSVVGDGHRRQRLGARAGAPTTGSSPVGPSASAALSLPPTSTLTTILVPGAAPETLARAARTAAAIKSGTPASGSASDTTVGSCSGAAGGGSSGRPARPLRLASRPAALHCRHP